MTVLLLAIMAKAPRLGTVKTRLAGVLDEAGRLRLYRAFFLDKLDQARQVLGVKWLTSPRGSCSFALSAATVSASASRS